MQYLSSRHEISTFVDQVDVFLLDCDGVLWRGNELIPGVRETLQMLRNKGKRIFFITNNASKSRKNYQKKFQTLGIDVDYVCLNLTR
jgi:HAD superfamily hydrolase (TIGR01450 family)